MFSSLGWPEIAVLVVIALFVFGPERLPKMAAEAGRMLRTLRRLANDARDELQADLGPELGDLDLASLNPKTFVRKHLLEDEPILPQDPPRLPEQTRGPGGQRRLREGEQAPYDADAT